MGRANSSARPSDAPAATAASLERELDVLESRGAGELRTMWPAVMATTSPPPLTRDLLARVIAHCLQEHRLGGLDRRLRRLLQEMASGRAPTGPRLKIGSVLVRDYEGEMHEVMVAENGFRWQGSVYPSLSSVARAITGASWNGPRFFGVGQTANGGNRKATPADSAPARGGPAGRSGRSRRCNDATCGRDDVASVGGTAGGSRSATSDRTRVGGSRSLPDASRGNVSAPLPLDGGQL